MSVPPIHRNSRLRLDEDEPTFTLDQVMAARGLERKPGGGWQSRPADGSRG